MSEISEAFGLVKPTVIKFFRQGDPYGYMSNFSSHPILIDGKVWPTSEHWYQAQKFKDPEIQERIRLCKGPGSCAKMGRDRSLPMREDWDQIKDLVMRHVLLAKFTQHTDIKNELLSTGNEVLIEDSPYDSYWGCGRDGKGRNKLGLMLMWVRNILSVTQYDS